VRHVQGGVNGRAAIPLRAALAVAGHGSHRACLEIEPADLLIADLAEVQAAIWSDHEAIRVVDLGCGVASDPSAEYSADRHRHQCPPLIVPTFT
jgi:hypothetical protein